MSEKPTHIKPSLYAFIYFELKEIAKKYGYNLLLHGSLARDLDLIAVPWSETIRDHEAMLREFSKIIGGYFIIDKDFDELRATKSQKPHGRIAYHINLRRTEKTPAWNDLQYYLDISIIPSSPNKTTNMNWFNKHKNAVISHEALQKVPGPDRVHFEETDEEPTHDVEPSEDGTNFAFLALALAGEEQAAEPTEDTGGKVVQFDGGTGEGGGAGGDFTPDATTEVQETSESAIPDTQVVEDPIQEEPAAEEAATETAEN